MRTLGAIIEAAKSGEMPSHEECYWAMLALDSLGTFDRMALMRLLKSSEVLTPEFQFSESARRLKLALEQDPQSWVGPESDPASEHYQNMRKIGMNV
jgi:hypothetical protein